jgi:hypothetical protein
MNILEEIARRGQELPPDKQIEVLDFVEFLVARQARPGWTVKQRRAAVAKTMGSLANTHTSSEAFAAQKREEKAQEERRWNP